MEYLEIEHDFKMQSLKAVREQKKKMYDIKMEILTMKKRKLQQELHCENGRL